MQLELWESWPRCIQNQTSNQLIDLCSRPNWKHQRYLLLINQQIILCWVEAWHERSQLAGDSAKSALSCSTLRFWWHHQRPVSFSQKPDIKIAPGAPAFGAGAPLPIRIGRRFQTRNSCPTTSKLHGHVPLLDARRCDPRTYAAAHRGYAILWLPRQERFPTHHCSYKPGYPEPNVLQALRNVRSYADLTRAGGQMSTFTIYIYIYIKLYKYHI